MLSEEVTRSTPPGVKTRVEGYIQGLQLTPDQHEQLLFDLRERRFSNPNPDITVALTVINVLFEHWLDNHGRRYLALHPPADTALLSNVLYHLVARVATYRFERDEGGTLQYWRNAALYLLGLTPRCPKSHQTHLTELHGLSFEILGRLLLPYH